MTNPIFTRLAGGRRKRGPTAIRFVIAAVVVIVIAAIGLYFLTGSQTSGKVPPPAASTSG
jgi:hypothetical protein